MKRRITRSRPLPGDDDDDDNDNNDHEEKEEEECMSERKDNLRKRKKVNYRIEAPDYDDDEEDEDDEDEEEDEDEDKEEEKKDKEKNEDEEEDEHNQMTLGDSRLQVICENKKGILDTKQLSRGEACIEHKDRLFTPPEFEDFAGRGSAKKWKTSIFYNGKTLQHYFDRGLLTTTGFKKRRKESTEQTKTTPQDSEADKEDSENEVQLIEDSEDEGVASENDGQVRDSGDAKGKEEEDEMKNEEMEDKEMTAVAVIDDSVTQERIQSIIRAFYEQKEMKMKLEVALKRLPEVKTEHLDEDAHGDKESGHNSPATDDLHTSPAPCVDPLQMSDPLITEEGPSVTPPSEPAENEAPGHTDVSSIHINAVQSGVIKQETSPQTSQTPSGCILDALIIPLPAEFSAIEEAPDVDFDQLKREKLKWQLRVLRLQEEYYSLKINKFKRCPTGD